MTYKILVAADLTDASLNLIRVAEDAELLTCAPNTPALREKLAEAHAIISRDDVLLNKSLLDAAPKLKLIARVGVSLSGVDLEAATNRGIVVMNTPGTNAVAAGELTLTLMLALSRHLVSAHTRLKEGLWLLDRKRQEGSQLQGKTLGLVGMGRVGSIVAGRALAFGMNVLAYDPYLGDEEIDDERVQLVGLKELQTRSDFISLHVPFTRETRTLIDEAFISAMKPGARLINTAHGSVIDEAALAAALQSGHLAGAALDVFSEEPPDNSPLIGMESVIHTPHIGDNTHETMQDLSLQIVSQVLDALRGDDYRNVVNLPFVAGLDYETAQPYMALAERMGKILQSLARTRVRRIAVEYRGEEAGGIVKPVTVALLKGILAPVFSDLVNYINAPILAAERGIAVTQAKGLKTGNYASVVSVQATLEDGEVITIGGTLMDRREPHIVQINDYRLNFVPEGMLLIMGSFDQPGVIGRVGTLFADNNINIAIWQTGRATPGGHTLTVLTLDEPMPESLLETLRGQDFVRHAHQVEL
ncbi:MAG: phosphoglycerate dehydrogenase [Anaerolineae bacterium]|nr:phosphoglycerate dehydrogenase [Anaerolineae bacterium]